MVGSVYSGLIVLVDWLIKLFVFHKISGLKWEIKKDSAKLSSHSAVSSIRGK